MNDFAIRSGDRDVGVVSDFGFHGAGGQDAGAWQNAVDKVQLGQDAAPDGSAGMDDAAGQAGHVQPTMVLAEVQGGTAFAVGLGSHRCRPDRRGHDAKCRDDPVLGRPKRPVRP